MNRMTTESLAKRYIGYLGVKLKTKDVEKPFNVSIGGFMFTSYSAFLFGGTETRYLGGVFREKSYNELVPESFDPCKRTLEYSSAEELDFKLSAMGF